MKKIILLLMIFVNTLFALEGNQRRIHIDCVTKNANVLTECKVLVEYPDGSYKKAVYNRTGKFDFNGRTISQAYELGWEVDIKLIDAVLFKAIVPTFSSSSNPTT